MKESTLLGDRILRIKPERWTLEDNKKFPESSLAAMIYRSPRGIAIIDRTHEFGSDPDWSWKAEVHLHAFSEEIAAGTKQPLPFYGRSIEYLEQFLGILSAKAQAPEFVDLADFEAEPLPEVADGVCLDPDPGLEICAGCRMPKGDGGPDRCVCLEYSEPVVGHRAFAPE